ncbi:MAG: TolC family protein [Deltaproteobacteria bacterium]|nr:TolC family protein [Deltaproteobacteria bacterium]
MRNLLCQCCCLLAFVAGAGAQAPLSFEDCVMDAAENNSDLRAASYKLRASDYRKSAAHSGYLPQLSGDLGINRGNSGGIQGLDGGDSNLIGSSSNKTRSTAAIGLTQNLFAGFQTEAAVEQAEADRKISSADLEIVKAQVSADLRVAFGALQYSRNYMQLAKEIIKRRDENYKLVELRYESGNENKGSHLRAHAVLSEARFDELQAGNDIRVSQQQLAKVLGRSHGDDLQISGAVPLDVPESNPDFESLMKSAPEERRAWARQLAADAALKTAKSKFYPSLDLTGQLARENLHGGGDDGRNRWQTGLTLRMPLFTGGSNYYGSKSALQEVLAAGSDRKSVDRSLLLTLRQTHADYLEAIAKVAVDREYVEAARVRAEIARAKYNNGLLSFEDWDIIENDMISRQKMLLQSEYNRIVAGAAWEQSQGKGVFP